MDVSSLRGNVTRTVIKGRESTSQCHDQPDEEACSSRAPAWHFRPQHPSLSSSDQVSVWPLCFTLRRSNMCCPSKVLIPGPVQAPSSQREPQHLHVFQPCPLSSLQCLQMASLVSPPSSTLLLFFLLRLQPASSSLPPSPVSGLDPQNLKCSAFFIPLPCSFTSIGWPSSTLVWCLASADLHSSSPAQTSTSPGSPPPAPMTTRRGSGLCCSSLRL